MGDIQDWNDAATSYATQVGGPADSFFRRFDPVLQRHLTGPRVLDVGCGHGWYAALLAQRGCDVTGIDGSRALLDEAREAYPAGRWVQHDLALGLPDGLGTFDGAFAHMVMMDLPVVQPLLHDLRASLADGGTFSFSLLHPAFFNYALDHDVTTGERFRRVTGYLDPEVWRIDSFGGHNHYHRALSFYVQALRDTGFAVVDLDEQPALESPADDGEVWYASIPTMLSIAARAV